MMSGNNNKQNKNSKKKSTSLKKEGEDLKKSILKNPEEPADKGNKSITWDETNVIATLHPAGKDYGHMKIDEPPTPFERSIGEMEAGLDPEELARRLEVMTRRSSTSSGSVDSSYLSDDEDESPPVERRKKDDFKKKRAIHYNEFLEAKRKLAELPEETDDEDDGDQRGNNKGKNNNKGKHK